MDFLLDEEQVAIAYYAQVFDYYIEHQGLPLDYSGDRSVGLFIKQFVEHNLTEGKYGTSLLKMIREHVLGFIAVLLESTRVQREYYRIRAEKIVEFRDASIEEKRLLWPDAVKHIKEEYSPQDIDIDGYALLFGQYDNEAVFRAMLNDWERANDRKLDKAVQSQLDIKMSQHHDQLDPDRIGYDYERTQKVQKMVYSNEKLREILQLMGRNEESQHTQEMDSCIQSHMPIMLAHPPVVTERQEVSIGNNLSCMLPQETALLSDPVIEMLFYHKFASSKLLQFSNKTLMEDVRKVNNTKKPRPEKGPMILCIDTSGSMSGAPLVLANAMLDAALHIARNQKRKCFLIAFSVRVHCLELSGPEGWAMLEGWRKNFYTGSTDGEIMLNTCIKVLEKDEFKMADILIISDFCFPRPKKETCEAMKRHQKQGTRFYGLGINADREYDEYLDKLWNINRRIACKFYGN